MTTARHESVRRTKLMHVQEEVMDAQTLGKVAALLGGSARGRGYLVAVLRHEGEIRRLFRETPRLHAIWNKLPKRALVAAVHAAIEDPDSPIPAMLGDRQTKAVLVEMRKTLARYITDPDFLVQIDSAVDDLVAHIGRTWRQAVR